MIDWKPLTDLPCEIESGSRFLFCTVGHHITHVRLIELGDGMRCWATGIDEQSAPVMFDNEMALVSHFAEVNYPLISDDQLKAASVRMADLDGRYGAYAHDAFDR